MVADFASLRTQFPGTSRSTYMNVAARGLMTTGSRAAIDRMLDARLYGEADKAAMFDIIENSRRRYAALINAEPDEIAITKNVSEGLNAIIASYDWQRGDNAVICPDLEHPNNVFPWRNLAKRTGMDVKTVAPRDGQISVEAIADAIDGKTRMVTASSVTFAPGFRTDIAAIAKLCREKDILFLVQVVTMLMKRGFHI